MSILTRRLNNLPLFIDEANGDGDSLVLTGRTIEDEGVAGLEKSFQILAKVEVNGKF